MTGDPPALGEPASAGEPGSAREPASTREPALAGEAASSAAWWGRALRRRWPVVAAVVVVVVAVLAVGVALSARDRRVAQPPATGAPPATGVGPAGTGPTGLGPTGSGPAGDGPAAVCPPATVTVADAKGLERALGSARPGDSIRLRDGVYKGMFVATVPATAAAPIFLCGGSAAVLDGDSVTGGYGLHLNGASYWRLIGFTVRNGQKGVVADRVQHAVIQGLTVEHIGDEGIHLRAFSSDNLVAQNTVRDTGLRRDTFGEGIYIGTAESNWCAITDCQPDLSDRNVVRENRISQTTAESVDIKEGTTGGQVIGNTFDGSALSGSHNDSWVDVKGNGWLIQGNTGHNAKADGFQTHEVVKGWGTGNVFAANTAAVNGPGYGFALTPVNGNVVRCDNQVTGAGHGFANVACTK